MDSLPIDCLAKIFGYITDYYTYRLINKLCRHTMDHETVIPILSVRIFIDENVRLCTVFRKIVTVVPRWNHIITREDRQKSRSLNGWMKSIYWIRELDDLTSHHTIRCGMEAAITNGYIEVVKSLLFEEKYNPEKKIHSGFPMCC